jgi:holin-like protein
MPSSRPVDPLFPLAPPKATCPPAGIADPLLGVAALVGITHLGNVLTSALGLRIPGAVLGLMLLCASLHLLPWLRHVLSESAAVLLRLLPLMIIPAGVGVMQLEMDSHWLKFAAACLLAWIGTICVTALSIERIMRGTWTRPA